MTRSPPPPRDINEAALYVTRLIETLTEDDYATTLTAQGNRWDVYRRRDWNGVLHTVAFRKEGGAVVIGVVMPFHLSDRKIINLIERDAHGDMTLTMGQSPIDPPSRKTN